MAKITHTLLMICSLILLTTATSLVHAQGTESLVTPADPRSAAMAESFAGVRGSENALMYNPAGLAGRTGASFMYAQRSLDWAPAFWGSSFRYQLLSGSIETPWATVGLFYNRYIQPDLIVNGPESPDPVGQAKFVDYTLGLGAARSLGDYLDIGLTAKMFHQGISAGTAPFSASAKPAFLMDLGVLFRLDGESEALQAGHEFTIGLSAQNFGTMMKVTERFGPEMPSSHSFMPSRYLRAGFSYALTIHPGTEQGLTPFQLMVTGEYRRLLAGEWSGSTWDDYWGFGLETTMYEVLVIRTGGFLQPMTSIYGVAKIPALRYGAGIRVPFDRLGMGVPLTMEIDYAAMPVNTSGVSIATSGARSTLHILSAGVHYNAGLF